MLLPDLWWTLHLAGFWTWLLYKSCFLFVSSSSCCFFLLPVSQLWSMLFKQTYSLHSLVVYFCIAVTFLQWQSASLLCKKCSICQEQSCFTWVFLESVFNKKRKSSMRSTYLCDHGGRIAWGPCGENTKRMSCVLLILLGITQWTLSGWFAKSGSCVDVSECSQSYIWVFAVLGMDWYSSSFRGGFADCNTTVFRFYLEK